MASHNDDYHHDLVQRLTAGFGALYNQIHELASRNHDLEQRLALARDEVRQLLHLHPTPLAMTIRFGSRPVATAVAVMTTYKLLLSTHFLIDRSLATLDCAS